MDTRVLQETLQKSEAGQITFGEVVRTLSSIGVESYRADFLTAQDTFYTSEGTHVEPMTLPEIDVANDFSATEVVAAIRAAQSDSIRYPEFLVRIFNAGCVAYQVFLTGQKVVYFGRKGECHVEEFPSSR